MNKGKVVRGGGRWTMVDSKSDGGTYRMVGRGWTRTMGLWTMVKGGRWENVMENGGMDNGEGWSMGW